MEYFNWEFTVLARAVAYSNLTTAAANIGLSQPQISRIISKIEQDFGVILLDRDAKRKSAWTPAAFKLTEIYASREAQIRADIAQLIEGSEPRHVRVGCLDGLYTLAADLSHRLVMTSAVEILELNIHDLNVLEERFLKGDYDFIFTSREPGRKKFSYRKPLGFQTLEFVGKGDINVLSTFEFSTGNPRGKENSGKTYISNALAVRQHWIENYGGRGTIPSEVKQKKPAKTEVQTVWLLANEQTSKKLWKEMTVSL